MAVPLSSESSVVLGLVIVACSGVPGLFLSRHGAAGQRLATLLAGVGCLLGLAGVAQFWRTGTMHELILPWSIPGGEFRVGMDGLSAFFLVPIFLLTLLCSLYGLAYWDQRVHPANGRKLRLFFGLLAASMALVVLARNGVLFLVGWEIMALAAYFLVITDDHDEEVRESGWIFLVSTHCSTLCLFAVFGLLAAASGSFTLQPLAAGQVHPAVVSAIFGLCLVGFGLKAGLMPLHVWLPGAHAMAPSHVSAMLSGVMIKMGIYGLVRLTGLLPTPPVAWGGIVLTLGVVSGILGVVFAIAQHDLKRLLAYHSIENIGIILLGLGLALLGRSLDRPDWIVLGLGGALLHVWNHALFKALLFLSAGSVIHATGTRALDRLGGLAKRMPWTALGFLLGAVAICGLPPLNGFVSEFLVYLGLFHTVEGAASPSVTAAAFAAPALAFIGALAVACFVKVYGIVFLGTARTESAEQAHEAPLAMLGPMAVLAACCIVIGLAPQLLVPRLAQGIADWAPAVAHPGSRLLSLAPLGWLTLLGSALIGGVLLVGTVLWLRLRTSAVRTAGTWGCGYLAPTARMQYTASSFAQTLVGLFTWVLRPDVHEPGSLPLFPAKTSFYSHAPDALLEGVVRPAFRGGAWLCSWARVFQQGSLQMYLVYIAAAVLVLILWH